jgi:peptidoglycan/xylan/chitin deacetylase (PgdA/CDA1 family)
MHNRVRFYISALFYYTGLVKLVRWCSQRSKRSLTILYYHSAVGKNLCHQWLYLRRHYRILPLDAALEELQTPCRETCAKQDHRPLLAITFDDGYYDNYTHAFALASALEIPITIFLIPGYTGLANAFWWADRFIRLAHVDQATFEGRTYHLSQPEERKALAQVIDERVSHMTSKVDQRQLLISLCELLAIPSSALTREEPAPLLIWDQIREMEDSGWVSFGAHTLHHVDLQHSTHFAEVLDEVDGCRTLLARHLRNSVDIFAYPHGHVGDYGLRAVKQTGYKWALTTVPGRNTQRSNPYLLRRRNADADRQTVIMAAEVAGIWNFFTHLKKLAKHNI